MHRAQVAGLASRIIRKVTIGKPKSTLKNTIWKGEYSRRDT
jgi:hypothetical protein